MSRKQQWRHSLMATVVAAVLIYTTIGAREILDRHAQPDPVLDPIAAELDARGIDVVRGNTGTVVMGARPRVARLIGMPMTRPDGYVNAPWMREFVAGRAGGVAGIATTGRGTELAQDVFLKAWSASPREHRVFLSFTRADAGAARAGAAALNAKGYKTFLFLNEASHLSYDAGTIGRLFAESGHQFVLDTPNARRSIGVWLEARVARVTAAREARYIPDPGTETGRVVANGRPTGGSGNGRGGGIDLLKDRYAGPREPVENLFKDMDKLPGGVMFGNRAAPCAALGSAAIGLEYRRANANGARLVLTTATGSSTVTANDDDIEIIARFVETNQPALVSLSLVGQAPAVPDDSLRRVDVHPALIDTSLGELLIRADMMVWPVLDKDEQTYAGVRLSGNPSIDRLRAVLVGDLKQVMSAGRIDVSGKAASNINDVTAQASFCAANGRASLAGTPGVDVLMTGTDGKSSVRLAETSTQLYRHQSVLRSVDVAAYDAVVRTFQLSGLMNHVKRTNTTSWSAFVSSLPPVRHGTPTSRLVCPGCDPEALVNWIASRSGVR